MSLVPLSAASLLVTGLVPCRGDGVAHIILAVTDEGAPRLTSYRRVILHVHAGHKP